MSANSNNGGVLLIRECIKLLSDGKVLTTEQIMGSMREIMSGEAAPSQVAAFLTALRFNPLTSHVLHSSATIMSSFALECNVHDDIEVEQFLHRDVIDIVGTGGDTADTFNASTASAFVVAACGLKVAKHGNRSSSGRCGSADLVEALGAKLTISSADVCRIIKKLNFGFLFAQTFHPAMKSVAPIRKEIGIRTLFNVLGPLTNPAKPNLMLVGVGTEELGPLYAEVFQLQQLEEQQKEDSERKHNPKRAMVVHSYDGLDEISTAGRTRVWIINEGKISEKEISPVEDFGLSLHPIESILGSSPQDNVNTFLSLLKGEGETNDKLRPVLDFVLLNASAALFVGGRVKDFKEGVAMAKEAIQSGKVLKLVQDYIHETNQVVQQ